MTNIFLSGAIFGAYLVVTLFFVKFWQKNKDPLFLRFSLAFLLLGIERLATLFTAGSDLFPYIYTIRLFACLIIIYAIIMKNCESQ
jgi:hypothetical protein